MMINQVGPQAPTPDDAVEEALGIMNLNSESVPCDLGCGDARVLIKAVQRSGCRGIGVEIDIEKVEQARRLIADQGLSHRIQIIHGDVRDFDPARHSVTHAYCYLYPELLQEIAPILRKIPVVVSAGHQIPGLEGQVLVGQCWVHRT